MGSTPLASYPYPDLTDPPDGPGQFLAALAAAERRDVLGYADAAARNAAIVSPTDGMLVYLSTPKVYTWYDGTTWQGEWASYTPTSANLTVGNGALAGAYAIGIDNMVDFWASFTLGSTSAMGTSPRLGLPAASAYTTIHQVDISVVCTDTSAGQFVPGPAGFQTASEMACYSLNTGNTTAAPIGGISSTGPFTWANTDILAIRGRYRRA